MRNGVRIVIMGLLFCLAPGLGQAQSDELFGGKTWAQMQLEAKNYFPERYEEAKESLLMLRIVRKPKTVLASYDEEPQLWRTINDFYGLIQGRELDVYAEQPGIPEFFPNRDTYYDFLDTMIPAMRDRKFERNRVLEYTVHSITPIEGDVGGDLEVVVSIVSDDTFPFGKTMIFNQKWHSSGVGWYPGKVSAEPATLWERLR